jgi:hypothetical protein
VGAAQSSRELHVELKQVLLGAQSLEPLVADGLH